MVLDQGATWRQAAQATGVSMGGLASTIKRLQEQPERIKEASDRVAAANVTIATQAAERVYGMLDELQPQDLIRVWGIASDKVALHAGWGRDREAASGTGTSDALAKLAEAIAGGGSVTLTVAPAEPALVGASTESEGE